MNIGIEFEVEPDFETFSSALFFVGEKEKEWRVFRKNAEECLELPDNGARLWALRSQLFTMFYHFFLTNKFIRRKTTERDLSICFLPGKEIKILFPAAVVPALDDDVRHAFALYFLPDKNGNEKITSHIICDSPAFQFLVLGSLASWRGLLSNEEIELGPASELNSFAFVPFHKMPAFMNTMGEVWRLVGPKRVSDLASLLSPKSR